MSHFGEAAMAALFERITLDFSPYRPDNRVHGGARRGKPL
jgi:hypothetical protein